MKNPILLFVLSVLMIQPTMAQLQFEIFTEADGLPEKTVRGLDVDSENTLWIGTQNGLAKWDGQTFTAIPTQDNVSNPYCSVVRVAPDGNIWVGYFTTPTEGDISVYSQDGQLVMHADNSTVDLGSNMITDIEFDENGIAWIAHFSGITTYDGTDWNFMPPENTNFAAAPVQDIEFDDNGGYYVSTVFGLSYFDGNSWTYYNNFNSNIGDNQVRRTNIAGDGRIWASTHSGISILENGTFENYTIDDGLPTELIRDIQFDFNGDAWIATDDGFSIYDGVSFKNYETHPPSSIDNQIENILIDDVIGIWMTTRDGLVRVLGGPVNVFEKPALIDFELTLYPTLLKNGGELNFRVNEIRHGAIKVLIFDNMGRPVFTKDIMNWGQQSFVLQLPNLNDGMYTLNLEQEGRRGVGSRFVVVD